MELVEDVPPFEIVVVDDDEDIMEAIVDIIQAHYGKTVSVKGFEKPTESIEFAKKNKVDIFISDQVMPEIKGDQLISQVRAFNPGGFYLICTGAADLHLAFTTRQEGVHGLVEKPISAESLKRALDPFMAILGAWNRAITHQLHKGD